jgi:hypothetical protein
MFKMKLGAIVGFALGWLVGSGRAAKLWDQLQDAATRRAGGAGPVAVPAADRSTAPPGAAARDVRTMSVG